ncbi:glutathione transferase GstA [Terrarubrum flagellatum]|uniref:glutathione transferase GstA n=1 Tax=Terrirubrum flagellatum TaxID=2895980 RepID=UPI0031456207
MKLYFTPGACSLSPHIVLHEAGAAHELVRVDLKTKKTEAGDDYLAINPKGQVPALALDNGAVLTEGPAIVQYIADKKPEAKLAPANGSTERYRLQEWLNYLTSEIHKSFSPLFGADTPAEFKTIATNKLNKQFAFLDKKLAGDGYLTGKDFSVADAYLFTLTNWAKPVAIDLAPYPNLVAYRERVAARPAVQAAMMDEGLIKKA